MIELEAWISQAEGDIELISKNYDVTYTYIDGCDDRGDWTLNYIKKVSNKIISVVYEPSNVALLIGDKKYGIKDLDSYKIPKGKILIDATSLALPELVHLFGILDNAKISFDIIYVQPTEYTGSETNGLDNIKTFSLSDDGLGIQQVQPYIGYSTKSTTFFFLGWEGHRFRSFINSDEFDISDITCLIGIPPFKIAWENKTLSSNYKQLIDIKSKFKFAGANDPIKTYELIEKMYRSAIYNKRKLCLAPFGTKPAAIAAAQFAVNKRDIVMLYDFVKKKKKRSSGTDLVHLWEFKCS